MNLEVSKFLDGVVSDARREFPKRLAWQREKMGMSVVELAVLIGSTKQAIYQYEDGRVMPGSVGLAKLAAILRVAPGWLLGFED